MTLKFVSHEIYVVCLFLVLRALGMVIRDCDIIYHPKCVPNQKKYYRSLSEKFVQRCDVLAAILVFSR